MKLLIGFENRSTLILSSTILTFRSKYTNPSWAATYIVNLICRECNLDDSGAFPKSFHGIYTNKVLQATSLDLDVTVVDGIHDMHLLFIFNCPYARPKW